MKQWDAQKVNSIYSNQLFNINFQCCANKSINYRIKLKKKLRNFPVHIKIRNFWLKFMTLFPWPKESGGFDKKHQWETWKTARTCNLGHFISHSRLLAAAAPKPQNVCQLTASPQMQLLHAVMTKAQPKKWKSRRGIERMEKKVKNFRDRSKTTGNSLPHATTTHTNAVPAQLAMKLIFHAVLSTHATKDAFKRSSCPGPLLWLHAPASAPACLPSSPKIQNGAPPRGQHLTAQHLESRRGQAHAICQLSPKKQRLLARSFVLSSALAGTVLLSIVNFAFLYVVCWSLTEKRG